MGYGGVQSADADIDVPAQIHGKPNLRKVGSENGTAEGYDVLEFLNQRKHS